MGPEYLFLDLANLIEGEALAFTQANSQAPSFGTYGHFAPMHIGIIARSVMCANMKALKITWSVHFVRERQQLICCPAVGAKTGFTLDAHMQYHVGEHVQLNLTPRIHLINEWRSMKMIRPSQTNIKGKMVVPNIARPRLSPQKAMWLYRHAWRGAGLYYRIPNRNGSCRGASLAPSVH